MFLLRERLHIRQVIRVPPCGPLANSLGLGRGVDPLARLSLELRTGYAGGAARADSNFPGGVLIHPAVALGRGENSGARGLRGRGNSLGCSFGGRWGGLGLRFCIPLGPFGVVRLLFLCLSHGRLFGSEHGTRARAELRGSDGRSTRRGGGARRISASLKCRGLRATGLDDVSPTTRSSHAHIR